MRKGLALLSIAWTFGSLGVFAVACEDATPASGFGDNPDGGAQFHTGPGFVIDGATGNGGGSSITCTPSLPATFAPVWKPPTKSSKCGAADVAAYYDACAGNLTLP